VSVGDSILLLDCSPVCATSTDPVPAGSPDGAKELIVEVIISASGDNVAGLLGTKFRVYFPI
jgi:hypothetical protein